MQNNHITKLLSLEGFTVKDLITEEEKVIIRIQSSRKQHYSCPHCNSEKTEVHDHRIQLIRDFPLYDKATFLEIRRTRYRCRQCQKRFTPKLTFCQSRTQMTNRLKQRILHSFSKMRSLREIAQDNYVSIMSVSRILSQMNIHARPLPSVLCIDEFKGDSGKEKFQVILADGQYHQVTDILPTRKMMPLQGYFSHLSAKERGKVTHFVSDMYPSYAAIHQTFFPKSIHVIDPYHFIRQVSWALENVRKNEQRKMGFRERLHFKRSRSLLTRPSRMLCAMEKIKVANMLEKNEPIRRAYALKEAFYEKVLPSCQYDEAERHLTQWMRLVEQSGLKEFSACLSAFRHWKEPILNSFTCPWSNGFVEGTNNRIKTLKRVTFGMRNFTRFRNRLLCILK